MVDVVILTSPDTTALIAQSREELETVNAVPVVDKVNEEVPLWIALVIVKGPLENPEVVKDLLEAKVELAAPLPKLIPPVAELFNVTFPFKVFIPPKAMLISAPPVEAFVKVTSLLKISPLVFANRILAVFDELFVMVIEPELFPKVFPPVQSLWLLLAAILVIEIFPETVAKLFALVRVIFWPL